MGAGCCAVMMKLKLIKNITILSTKFDTTKPNMLVPSDYVLTPEWCAQDMVTHFNPTGTILDPCRGLNKVFHNILPANSCWCEIQEGRDFFKFTQKVDWIIGNPPYSIFNAWMQHSFSLSDNIVYLLPTFKVFNSLGLYRIYNKNGWIKHIRFYDVGKRIEWSRSRPIVVVHFKKGYFSDTSWSHY